MILPREIIPSSSFFKGSLSQGLVELRAKSGKQAGLGVRRNAMRGSHAVVGGRISFYSQCSTFCFPHFRNLTLESEWQCPPSIWLLNGKISICTLRILHCQLGLPEDYQRINTCTLNVPSGIQTWLAGKSKIYLDDFPMIHVIFNIMKQPSWITGGFSMGFSQRFPWWNRRLPYLWLFIAEYFVGFFLVKPGIPSKTLVILSNSKFSYQRPFMNLGRP